MTAIRIRSFALLLLVLVAGPLAAAAAGPACGVLCGDWRLDAAASDNATQVLDAAFAQFKDPKPRHRPMPMDDDVAVLGAVADEESLGPTFNRFPRQELRDELQQMLRQPAQLHFSATGRDIRIATEAGLANRLTPGEPHSRVDRYGTARISANWKGARLAVTEKYDRKNQQETTFSLRSADDTLEVLQVITRKGLPRVSFRTVYRRLASGGLESAS